MVVCRDLWLFTGGLSSFAGGLWRFMVVCGGVWSLPVLETPNFSIRILSHRDSAPYFD